MSPVRKALGRRPMSPRITLPFAMLPISLISKNSPTYANRIERVSISVLIRFWYWRGSTSVRGFGGSPRIHARGGALQRSGKGCLRRWALALASGFPRLKPIVSSRFFRWTEFQLPLLKQGAPTVLPAEAALPPDCEPDTSLLLCASRRDVGSYTRADLRLGASVDSKMGWG